MRHALRIAALVACAVSATGCSPYEPSLSPAPFFCGEAEPRCPNGYTCMQAGASDASREVCVAPEGEIPVDALVCNADGLEPNNTLASAGDSSADMKRTVELTGLAICPPGDKDTFKIPIGTADENIEVTVNGGIEGAVLEIAILNEGGVPIAHGSQVTPTAATAVAPKVAVGTYYAQVQDTKYGTNNYALTIKITN